MKTLQQLIKQNKFNYVNIYITTEHFSAPKGLRKDYKLFHFERYISSEDAIKEMEKEGYAPANIYELLSRKERSSTDWVVALGSVAQVDGDLLVPYLDGNESRRGLDLGWFDHGWDGACRFLAIRTGSKTLKTQSPSALILGYLDAAQENINKARELIK